MKVCCSKNPNTVKFSALFSVCAVWLLSLGKTPLEEERTMSRFSIPDNVEPSTSAKGTWKMELDKSSLTSKGITKLIIFPPANAPIGEYTLQVKYKDEEILLANLVLLFNPWCLGRSIYLSRC